MATLSMWNRRGAFRATLVLIVVVAAWRIFLFATRTDPSFRIYFAFDTRADELLIGCTLALCKIECW
jgi:peptidoglycan/LPS O-acetylase OafA/YrhL